MKVTSLILVMVLFTMLFASLLISIPVTAASSSVTGVIFRADVNEIYIEYESMPVEVQATYFLSGIPQTASINIVFIIENLTSTQTIARNFTVPSGIPYTVYLPALPPGYYQISAEATAQGYQSSPFSEQFLVAPPPVPYTAIWVNGGLFEFHSNMLNSTGHYNRNYTFTLVISYQYPGSAPQTTDVVYNVTNFTMRFPDQGETVVIIVEDKYGWIDGMGINPSEGIFSGPPYIYNFDITSQAPFTTVEIENGIVVGIFVMFIVIVLLRVRRRMQ